MKLLKSILLFFTPLTVFTLSIGYYSFLIGGGFKITGVVDNFYAPFGIFICIVIGTGIAVMNYYEW